MFLHVAVLWILQGYSAECSQRITIIRENQDATTLIGCWSGLQGTEDGGGVKVVFSQGNGNGDVHLNGCSFINMRANRGGAVFTQQMYSEIVNCVFEQTEATNGRGGAIFAHMSFGVQIRSSNFTACRATAGGGAFNLVASTQESTPYFHFWINECNFTECNGGDVEGSICSVTGDSVKGASFDDCHVYGSSDFNAQSGFKLKCSDNFAVVRSSFDISGTFSVGLWDINKTSVSFEEVTVKNVRAGDTGIPTFCIPPNSWATYQNCHFINLSVRYEGCAIDSNNMTNLVVTGCTFEQCVLREAGGDAQRGGVVLVRASTTSQLTNCTFSKNSGNCQAQSLRIVTDQQTTTVTKCQFLGHTGSLPVLKVSPIPSSASFLAEYSVQMNQCTFQDNHLDGTQTSLVEIRSATNFTNCVFLNQDSSGIKTGGQCAFADCYFCQYVDANALYPMVHDTEPSTLSFANCSFAHTCAEIPNTAQGLYLNITYDSTVHFADHTCMDLVKNIAIHSVGNITYGPESSEDSVFYNCELWSKPPSDPTPTATFTAPPPQAGGKKPPVAAIVAGAVVGVVVIVVIIIIVVVMRRKQATHTHSEHELSEETQVSTQSSIDSYMEDANASMATEQIHMQMFTAEFEEITY